MSAIPFPSRLSHPGATAEAVLEAITTYGAAAVYTGLASWSELPERELRALLGVDLARAAMQAEGAVRDRSVAARLLIKHLVAVVLGVSPHSVELAYTPGGRPYVRGCQPVEISLSHTDEMLVAGLSMIGRIGVDVERADRSMLGIEIRLCTPAEMRELAMLDERDRHAELLRIWTLKEAYSKALGQGLRLSFSEFGFVRPGSRNAAYLAAPDGRPVDQDRWSFGTFEVPGHLISVAGQDQEVGAADITAAPMLDRGLLSTVVAEVVPRLERTSNHPGDPRKRNHRDKEKHHGYPDPG